MNEYKLSFTVSINAQDDPEARKQAKKLVEAIDAVVSDIDVKLQQVYMDKPPRGVKLGR